MQSKLVFFFNEISRKPFFRDTSKSIITLFPVSFSSPSYSSLPPSPFPQLSFSLLFPSFPLFSLTSLCLPSLSSLLPSLPFLFFFFFLAYVVTVLIFLWLITFFFFCKSVISTHVGLVQTETTPSKQKYPSFLEQHMEWHSMRPSTKRCTWVRAIPNTHRDWEKRLKEI